MGLETVRVYTEDFDGYGTLNFGSVSQEIVFAMSESPKPPDDPFATVPGTQPNGSFVHFGVGTISAIPADFFFPGSDPFSGRVELKGDFIDQATLGSASVVTERLGTPVLSDAPVGTNGTVDTKVQRRCPHPRAQRSKPNSEIVGRCWT